MPEQSQMPSSNNLPTMTEFNYKRFLPSGWELRAWQKEFLERFHGSAIQQLSKTPSDIDAFTLYAFPGAGKSLAQCMAAKVLIEHGFIDYVIFCVPSQTLVSQMQSDASAIGLELSNRSRPKVGIHNGEVLTYAKLCAKKDGLHETASELKEFCKNNKVMVCADEMHHLAEGKDWGSLFKTAFDDYAVARLLTSGTPFRSDNVKIPWVRYKRKQIDLAPPHGYAYSYGPKSKFNAKYCALNDQCVRDVVIVPWDGKVSFTMTKKDSHTNQTLYSDEYNLLMSDNVDALYPDDTDPVSGEVIQNNAPLRKRIKTARRKACLECGTERHPNGTQYVQAQLKAANAKLAEIREGAHPYASGLIVCKDKEHADAMAIALKNLTGEDSVVVHTDNPNSRRAIEAFKKNTSQARAKWLIAVNQVSEGVSIKHLRVCVYMTTIQAPLRWTQILGRILRKEDSIPWELQTAYFYQYDDGIEMGEDEFGDYTEISCGIKLFAESLMEERHVTLEAKDIKVCEVCGKNPCICPKPPGPDNTPSPVYYDTKTTDATGYNDSQIYEGKRHELEDLECYQVLSARIGVPAVRIKTMVDEGGKDNWLKALNKVIDNG